MSELLRDAGWTDRRLLGSLLAVVLIGGCASQEGSRAGASGNGDNGNVSENDNQPDSGGSNDNSASNDNETPPDDTGLPCISCHSSAMGDRRAVVDDSGAGGHSLSGETLANDDCQVCHELTQHQEGAVRLWADANDHASVISLSGDPAVDRSEADKLAPFCTACHGDLDYTVHPGGDQEQACTVCHDLHDPDNENLSLVRASVHNPTLGESRPVVFTARTGAGSFDDGDPAADDGICQVCHTSTEYHRYDGTGEAHHNGEDCTACHTHASGFIPLVTAGVSCVGCHKAPQGSRRAVVDASGAGGHHLEADRLSDTDCQRCHEMSLHQGGKVRLWSTPGTVSAVITADGDGSPLIPFCTSCHGGATGPAAHTTASAWDPPCTACHDLHDPANANLSLITASAWNQTLSLDKPVVFTASTGAGSFNDGTGANDGVCQVCHTATTHHRHDGGGTAHNEGADCTSCHPHNAGFGRPSGWEISHSQGLSCTVCHVGTGGGEPTCVGCHTRPQGSRPAVVNATGTGSHPIQGGVLNSAGCVVCHDTAQHKLGVVRLWENPNSPSSSLAVTGDPGTLVPFCTSCHSGADAPTVHATQAAWEPACTVCHKVHNPGNANLALVASTIRNQTLGGDKPVAFTATTGAGSFSDGTGANDGVCQVCHTTTTHHRHDGGGTPHNEGADCTVCHAHRAGFAPGAGGQGSCTGCHSAAQGSRRAVVSEFGMASHHVHGSGVTDTDCQICHQMSQHQQGQVRLKNVDDPANTALVIALNGDPLTNATEAGRLELFCLACHDGNGAGGAAPFSDGAMPPPIDPAVWAVGSHRTAQTTCVGDGETFGCHGTGHGSAKARLLAPWSGSQPGVPGDPLRQEEGMCYTCHDADGPAATNIQAQFALASRHNVSSVDQADGSRVECTNCHDPHKVGPADRLIDPDSRQVWTGGAKAFCLKCHDGAPPAGVSFPTSAPGVRFDKSSFAGTTHDTQLGSDSCRYCHAMHGSPHVAILEQRYVVNDHNPYTAGDGDYAACWSCHGENRIIQQVNAFDNKHAKHVKDKATPCILCHEVHGGSDSGEPGLIDMARPIARGGYDIHFIDGRNAGTSFWISTDTTRGNCYVSCHSVNHRPKEYVR